MNTTPESASTSLYDILDVHRVDPGLGRFKEMAAVRVGGSDVPDAKAVEEKLRAIAPEKLGEEVRKMLDVDLLKLLAGAWSQSANVRQAVVKSIGPPPTEQSVKLPGHEVVGKLKPRLVLSFKGVDFADIDFEVSLSVTITSATLTIHDGALTAVQFANVKGALKLSCEGTMLREYSKALELAPIYRLARPIALARPLQSTKSS